MTESLVAAGMTPLKAAPVAIDTLDGGEGGEENGDTLSYAGSEVPNAAEILMIIHQEAIPRQVTPT